MESVKDFLAVDYGEGHGESYGEGYRDGSGFGEGEGSGYGHSSGKGDGDGLGSGYDYGEGKGDGHGYGEGAGEYSGDGYADGYSDIKRIFGKEVHVIDGIQTIIDRVRFGYAVGHILNGDLTLTPCFVAKSGNYFAHGKTLKGAQNAVADKVLQNETEEERIKAFWACHTTDGKYSGQDLYDWHHRLTGSCEMGRQRFIKDKGLNIDSEYTVREFVEICKDAYGGGTIRRLADRWED